MFVMSNSNIPNELAFEILKRSLMRFRCVSKYFDSLTLEPLFIEAHQKSRLADFLVYYITLNEKIIIYNLGQDDLTCVSCPIKYLNDPCFQNLNRYSESINGIVCMWNNRGDVAICNPFTREHVCLVIDNSLSYWIFSIGVDKSWRKAYINIPNFFHKRKESVCIDGVIYFINFFGQRNIVAFSVRDEKVICTILLPDEIIRGYSPKLIHVKGQVAALVNTSNFQIINLYVLQNETLWVKQSIELPS
ncbi:hypothetical protein H5410_061394, partial [Solanum commersonii]